MRAAALVSAVVFLTALLVAGAIPMREGSVMLPKIKNPKLQWLLFYTCLTKEVANQCDEGFDPTTQGGWCNLGFTNSTSLVAKGAENHMMSLYAVHDIFFVNGKGLRPDYLEAWHQVLPTLMPQIKSGAIRGFFIGDELVSGKGISGDDIATVVDVVSTLKVEYPHLFTWLNEGGTGWPAKFTSGRFPANLDVVSIDDYYLTVDEHRAWYNSTLYPMMHAKQGAFLVPAAYGSHINPNMTMAQYETTMSQLATDYFAWAAEDERIFGFAPWHWDSRSPSEVSFGKEVGVVDMPQLRSVWEAIGHALPAVPALKG